MGGGSDRRRGVRRACERHVSVAVDQAAVAHGQRRQIRSVCLRLVNGGDGQCDRRHGQRTVHVGDRVVGVYGAGRDDRVRVTSHVARRGGWCRERRLCRQRISVLAVLEARILDRQHRQRGTVRLGLVVCGDDQGRCGDRQPAAGEAERVVVGSEGPDHAVDRVWAVMNGAGGGGRCGAIRAAGHPGARQVLAVLEAADGGVKSRVGVAVLARFVVRRHCEHRLRHMQRARREKREAVIARQEAADRAGDAVVGDRARHRCRARAARGPGNSRCSEVLTVLEARDRGVEARVGVAVLAGLVVRGHSQPGRSHVQGPGCEREAVVDRGEAADRAGDAVVRNRACRCRRRRAAGGPGHA